MRGKNIIKQYLKDIMEMKSTPTVCMSKVVKNMAYCGGDTDSMCLDKYTYNRNLDELEPKNNKGKK